MGRGMIEVEVRIDKTVETSVHVSDVIQAMNELPLVHRWNAIGKILSHIVLNDFDHLPFVAPWMGPLGSCLVKIFEVKREEGKVLFGVGNEEPPILAWIVAERFYTEWPQ